ncbi:MAG: 4-alpha-glucanotransferase, partial [Hungatella sp.]
GAGLLMPISALPSPYGIGTMGRSAYEFADQLKQARQQYWQVLPVGPTSYGDSPYQSFSAFAGNPYLIDLDMLVEAKLLLQEEIDACDWGGEFGYVDYDKQFASRFLVLKQAYERSKDSPLPEYLLFCCENRAWLDDYALYMACKFEFAHAGWQDWEEDIRFRKPEAVSRYRKKLSEEISFWSFLQFVFYGQWMALKTYVNDLGIQMIGDIPIYVALDSVDVWMHPELFQLDSKTLKPLKVAGVPPDAFSDDGQLWGNPLYDWKAIEETDFAWWKARMKASAGIYDVVRIDHFIGVVQYYAIPGDATDGKTGVWMKGPGKKLTDAIVSAVGDTKIIAEDLGIFSPEVKQLLAETGFPGMKILEFGFSGDRDNEHLPHNYIPNSVVYGGTHDNETLVGYFLQSQRNWWELQYIRDYMRIQNDGELVDRIFAVAYASVASVVIFQVQDVLKLGNEARMNTPGTLGANWRWRMKRDQIRQEHMEHLGWLVDIYGRF